MSVVSANCANLAKHRLYRNPFTTGSNRLVETGGNFFLRIIKDNNAHPEKVMAEQVEQQKPCSPCPCRLTYQQTKERLCLRIFQRSRLVKFIEKFKTRVKNLKTEKIIAFDKYLHELFFAFYFHLSKNLFLTLKYNEVADLTHFSTKCGCFISF